MIKAQRLRALLTQRLPQIESDKIMLFVTSGFLLTNANASAGYTQHYTAQLVLTDYAGEPDEVFGVVVDFMREQQADVMDNPALARDAISFESEIINHNIYDLMLSLKLSEDVSVNTVDGRTTYTHHAGLRLDAVAHAFLNLDGAELSTGAP